MGAPQFKDCASAPVETLDENSLMRLACVREVCSRQSDNVARGRPRGRG